MHTLYDSDSYLVCHLVADEEPSAGAADRVPALLRDGFEIVDKRLGREVFLEGTWAELFEQRLRAWQQDHPSPEEVEDTLAQYTELATLPVVLH